MIKHHSIKELVKGTQIDNQHQKSAHPKNSLIDCGGVHLTNVTWYLYTYHDKENLEVYNWNRSERTYFNYLECSYITLYVCNNKLNQGRQEETHHPTHRLPR